jgi:hypothetical protein
LTPLRRAHSRPAVVRLMIGAALPAGTDALLNAIWALIESTSWPYWRKDQLIRTIEALAEAQAMVDENDILPNDTVFLERFAAAMKLFAKC